MVVASCIKLPHLAVSRVQLRFSKRSYRAQLCKSQSKECPPTHANHDHSQLIPGSFQQEQVFDAFLQLLNVSTIEEARQLPSSALITANLVQVGLQSQYGEFTYGPVVDGLFTPALPGKLLLQGSYDKCIRVMLGHNADEGLAFTNPATTNNSALDTYLSIGFPNIIPSVKAYIENVLYPPVFDGSFGYTDGIGRLDLIISESTLS